MLSLLIGTMIYFLDSSLIVMLNLDLSFIPFLLAAFCISMILPGDNLGNSSLIFGISSIFPLIT